MSKASEGKFEFYEECASQWYDRLNSVDKEQHQQLMNSLINQPHQILDKFTRDDYQKRVQALNAVIPAEALYTLDNYIARTFYDATPSVEMLASVTTVKASKAHESKTYAGSDLGTARAVGAHGTFNDPPMIGMTVTPTFIKALGIHAGYQLGFSEIDEAGLYDIEWYHALKCGEKVGTLHEQTLALGEHAEDIEIDTGAVNGYHNYTGLQTCKFGVTDNVITSSGDLYQGFVQGLTKLKSVKEPGKIIFISTSGVHSETLILKDALGVSDFKNIKEAFFDPGHVSEWWINDEIDPTATMLITTQRCMLLKLSMNTVKREIVYPLQSRLMLDKQFSEDVKTMIMIMDIYKMYNANAGVIPDGNVTTSTLGFAQNGRIL